MILVRRYRRALMYKRHYADAASSEDRRLLNQLYSQVCLCLVLGVFAAFDLHSWLLYYQKDLRFQTPVPIKEIIKNHYSYRNWIT